MIEVRPPGVAAVDIATLSEKLEYTAWSANVALDTRNS